MYCIKCGKLISEGRICEECAAMERANDIEQINNAAPSYDYMYSNATQLPEPNNRMFGFGKALASTIMSNVGFIIAYIGIILICIESEFSNSVVIGPTLVYISLPLVIISLVFGILSINVFRQRKNTCAKPIATLVLGIVGTSTASVSAFFCFIGVILSFATL